MEFMVVNTNTKPISIRQSSIVTELGKSGEISNHEEDNKGNPANSVSIKFLAKSVDCETKKLNN